MHYYYIIVRPQCTVCEEAHVQYSLTLFLPVKTPAIFMPYVDNMICFTGFGFIESMLEPHAKDEAGATQAQVGYTFLLIGATYMVTTPVAGYVSLGRVFLFRAVPNVIKSFLSFSPIS